MPINRHKSSASARITNCLLKLCWSPSTPSDFPLPILWGGGSVGEKKMCVKACLSFQVCLCVNTQPGFQLYPLPLPLPAFGCYTFYAIWPNEHWLPWGTSLAKPLWVVEKTEKGSILSTFTLTKRQFSWAVLCCRFDFGFNHSILIFMCLLLLIWI